MNSLYYSLWNIPTGSCIWTFSPQLVILHGEVGEYLESRALHKGVGLWDVGVPVRWYTLAHSLSSLRFLIHPDRKKQAPIVTAKGPLSAPHLLLPWWLDSSNCGPESMLPQLSSWQLHSLSSEDRSNPVSKHQSGNWHLRGPFPLPTAPHCG